MASPRPKPSRSDTSDVEPRYLAMLEAERSGWWSSDNFDTWKTLYVSEYARGFHVLETLERYAGFRPEGARVLDVGCGEGRWVVEAAGHWTVRSHPLVPRLRSDVDYLSMLASSGLT